MIVYLSAISSHCIGDTTPQFLVSKVFLGLGMLNHKSDTRQPITKYLFEKYFGFAHYMH